MKIQKFYTPTGAEQPGAGAPATARQYKRRIPAKDNDFGQLCSQVNEQWKLIPAFILLYITQKEFEAKVAEFNGTLDSKQKTAGNRSPLTSQLAGADADIDNGLSQVKGYLKEKYEKKAPAYYASFGIERIGNSYRFPADRNKRKNLLKLVIAGIDAEGFAGKKYGAAYWSRLSTNYSALLQQATQTDGQVSSKVGDKNQLKQELTTVINSLIGLIEANYPHTFEGELRKWGFQKEKY